MSYPTTPTRPMSYAEGLRILVDKDVQDDISDACSKLAHAMSTMMSKFDSIAKQMHTLDLLRHGAPLKPRWDSMRKDVAGLLWQFRTNAAVISGRLKLFCTAVLPMVARCIDGRSGVKSHYHRESLQVLQSYMTISAEHAALTRSLVDRSMRLNTLLAGFSNEFAKLVSRHPVTGQKEMCDLSHRMSELEKHVQSLFLVTGELWSADITHLLYSSVRLVSSMGSTGGRSKLFRKRITLTGELSNSIGKAYEQLDRKRNEVAHAQYAAQMRQSRTDPGATAHTMVSEFCLDQLVNSENGLSLYLAIWSRLRTDCSDVLHWIKNPSGQQNVPPVISSYLESGTTLYASLAVALDVYAAGVDPSLYANERQERL